VKQSPPVHPPATPDPARRGETTSAHNQSNTTDADSGPGGTARARAEPQLPHEHDESSHSQASATQRHDAVGQQAYADATGPAVDTDRGPVLDKVYNEKVAPDRGAAAPRR
jgi:hypothetical protein